MQKSDMMKKYILILLFNGFILPCLAQISNSKIDRRIYLWDVTLSMQGYDQNAPKKYNADNDVWDKVVAFLKRDIENISDASTELILLPFQNDILARWEVKATAEGKAELARRIDESKTQFHKITNTNIAGPFRDVKDKYIDSKRNNLLILLTDGRNNVGGSEVWFKLLSSWQTYARDNNAYFIYFMVSKNAEDKAVEEIVDGQSYSEVVLPTDTIPEFIDLYPAESVNFNIKDDIENGVYIRFDNTKRAIALAPGIKISVKSSPDAKISIGDTAEIELDKLHFKLPYNSEELKAILNGEETVNIPLTIELLNQDEIQNNHQQKVFLKRNTVNLVLINKIEKVLNIKLKR